MKHIKNLVAITGKYTKDGEEKNEYRTIGKMFKREDDSVSIKIDSLPIGTTWNGWVSLYDPITAKDPMPEKAEKQDTKTEDDLPF